MALTVPRNSTTGVVKTSDRLVSDMVFEITREKRGEGRTQADEKSGGALPLY
jgi:hypothetical protein